MISAATRNNLERKRVYADQVQMVDGVPLFSWLDINPTELCNRRCVFCPRVDGEAYPNQDLNMDLALVRKIADELKHLRYRGMVVFSGFGEPLLYPELLDAITLFGSDIRVEIVTNGDRLTPRMAAALVNAGVGYVLVSMYDGPHQIERFTSIFDEAGIGNDKYALRDRWHSEDAGFGLKLTNRAGMVTVGQQDPVRTENPCFYPSYSMMVDWNGDVLLCVQDWNKRVKMGNLYAQTLVDVWRGNLINRYRFQLMNGRRKISPCNGCNADGTLHGCNHVGSWQKTIGNMPQPLKVEEKG
jgi:radical SAM protein with 4Fe4S-binding SPASM domain